MLPMQLFRRHTRSVARAGQPIPSEAMTAAAVPVVLAHQGGWDEMLFVLVPLLVFLTLQKLNRRKMREDDEDAQQPPSQK